MYHQPLTNAPARSRVRAVSALTSCGGYRSGYVYVEAHKEAHVRDAIQGLLHVFNGKKARPRHNCATPQLRHATIAPRHNCATPQLRHANANANARRCGR